jgi:AraC family transcriptional regulator
MIGHESGVRASVLSRSTWPGLSHVGVNLRWEREPGWISMSFEAPALLVATSEFGGRCQIRSQPDHPTDAEYVGTGHLSLIAAGQTAVIHAAEMREARFGCFLIDLGAADSLQPQHVAMLEQAGSRLMFKDERVYACANLLSAVTGSTDAFQASLSRALLAALIGVSTPPDRTQGGPRLTGAPLERVQAHIRDYLDQTITVDELAALAGMATGAFSRAFRDVTGQSPQRWQMDARVRSAQRLMIDDLSTSLAEVAALTGFSDQSHFSRAFLEIVGLTPTAWLHQRP